MRAGPEACFTRIRIVKIPPETFVDITTLNTKELADLIAQAQKRKRVLAKRKPIGQVRAAVNKVIRGSGYTFEELFGSAGASAAAKTPRARKAPRKVAKVEPKYRNPANAEETWSGRGKQPRWLAAYTAEGRKLEDFLINRPA